MKFLPVGILNNSACLLVASETFAYDREIDMGDYSMRKELYRPMPSRLFVRFLHAILFE